MNCQKKEGQYLHFYQRCSCREEIRAIFIFGTTGCNPARPEFKIWVWKLKFLVQRSREFTPGVRGSRKAGRGVNEGDAD